jgi:hypothetical protein
MATHIVDEADDERLLQLMTGRYQQNGKAGGRLPHRARMASLQRSTFYRKRTGNWG